VILKDIHNERFAVEWSKNRRTAMLVLKL